MNERFVSFRYVWLILTLLVVASFAYQAYKGINVESNILRLLPSDERDPVVDKAIQVLNENLGGKTVYIVSATDYQQARGAADLFYREMIRSNLFQSVTYHVDPKLQKQMFDTYFSHRQMLLSEKQRQLLKNTGFKALENNALAQLYSPISTPLLSLIDRDPLLLFGGVVDEMQSASVNGFAVKDGALVKTIDGHSYLLISAVIEKSPFSGQVQQLYGEFYQRSRITIEQNFPSVKLISSGVIYHATAGASSAKRQISTIGVGSLLGIVVLMLLAFRSLKPLWICLIPIVIGVISATTVCLLFYGKIHLFTLIFGASLIGVSIDYAFHFFAEQYDYQGRWIAQEGLSRILPGISLGLVTSLLGYLSLFAAEFPGLQQIALFSSVGLLASFCTVLAWFPVLLAQAPKVRHSKLKSLSLSLIHWWIKQPAEKSTLLVVGVALISLMVCLSSLVADDDIRILQSSPAALMEQDQKVRDITRQAGGNQFFIVKAKSVQKVLEKEEELRSELNQQVETGVITAYQSISQQIPSLALQQQDYLLLKNSVELSGSQLDVYGDSIGLGQKQIQAYRHLFGSEKGSPLHFDQLMVLPFLEPIRFLWLGRFDEYYVSTVILSGVANSEPLETLAAKLNGVRYIDTVQNISALLSRHRIIANYLVLAAYVLIFALLVLRYKVKKAVTVMLPPLTAAIVAMAVSALFSVPMNLFNTLALLLVLGIGIDYTLFFAEAGSHRRTTMLAIMLSAITTILSFGLLALSDTPVIHSFGLTLWVGIAVAFILSPLVIAGSASSNEKVLN